MCVSVYMYIYMYFPNSFSVSQFEKKGKNIDYSPPHPFLVKVIDFRDV